MSQRRRRKGNAVSVADAMDRVRWDYAPSPGGPAHGRSAGDFFDEFPWQGTSQDEEREPDTDDGD